MTKAFFKYLLTLCILLLSGYSQLSAQAHKEYASNTPIKNCSGVTLAGDGHQQNILPLNFKPHAAVSAEESQIDLIAPGYEAEDDEFAQFKKFLESSKYYAALLFAFTLAFLLRHHPTGSFSSGHVAYITSYRWHILLQVFRI